MNKNDIINYIGGDIMLGAIYGDKAGSIYEFEQVKGIKPINPEKLILSNSFYSDDTIETIAVIDAIINKKDYEQTLREYILNNLNINQIISHTLKHHFLLEQ